MDELRGHNRLEATGILLLFAVFLGVMLVVPSIRRASTLDAPTGQSAPPPRSGIDVLR